MEWTALYRDIVVRLEEGANLSAIASDLQRLSAQEPHSQRVAVLKATLAERNGDPQEAMRLLQSVIASQTDNAVARSNLARLQWKAGQRAEALASLRFSLLQDPQQERALHLYAAILEQQGGWGQAVSALKLLSQGPAHLPAWVAAELAASRAPEQLSELLQLSARQSRAPFPPDLATFTRLLAALPPEQQRETASALRPFCHPQAAAALDELLARTSAPPSEGSSSAFRLQRSVWRHLAEPWDETELGLSPVCLVRPESWGVGEIAGRLGRGFALLVTEQLDSCRGPSALVLLETVEPSGLVTRSAPQSGEALATLAAGTCHRLVSSYLSFQEPDRFILDVEHYDGQGRYLARESHRASHPGECLRQLADRLTALSPEPAPSAASPPPPRLDLDDALARDAVAALVLCSEGALHPTSLGNPGLLLDSLVAYALQSESHSALLCLWAAIEAAARANLPGATEQRPIVQQIIDANPSLAAWLRTSR